MSLQLRPASPLDAGPLAAIMTEWSRKTEWLPSIHSAAQDIAHIGTMIERGWVTVAELDRPLGFLAREDGYIHALFVGDSARQTGIGTALMLQAKATCHELSLWTFEANRAARGFYQRHGFFEINRNSGTANDEGLPEITYRWTRETA